MRIKRTRKVLYGALLELLTRRRFSKITVNDVCSAAMISRSAFYAHYKDKYDMLEQFLLEVSEQFTPFSGEILYAFIADWSAVVTNLLVDADVPQRVAVLKFITDLTNSSSLQHDDLLLDFVSGGLLNVVRLHFSGSVKPPDAELKSAVGRLYDALMRALAGDTF
jgi:AcrR family transcriptional regulator